MSLVYSVLNVFHIHQNQSDQALGVNMLEHFFEEIENEEAATLVYLMKSKR